MQFSKLSGKKLRNQFFPTRQIILKTFTYLSARAPTCFEESGWAGPCLIVSLSHPTEDDSDLNKR
jgi:hypothetical protein